MISFGQRNGFANRVQLSEVRSENGYGKIACSVGSGFVELGGTPPPRIP